jgi:hypothetical protein
MPSPLPLLLPLLVPLPAFLFVIPQGSAVAFASAFVLAVILSEAKDPETVHSPIPPEPFNQ